MGTTVRAWRAGKATPTRSAARLVANRCPTKCGTESTKDEQTPLQRLVHPRFASDWFAAWRSDKVSIVMLDGERREHQKARNYSWIVTSKQQQAATKAHLPQLRDVCMSPPFPCAICLRDGLGKTHELHRTPIVSGWPMRVNFDGLVAVYDRDQLVKRLELCRRIVRVLGKGGDVAKLIFTSHDAHVWGWQLGDNLLREWMAVRWQPLTRLAWFLCEGKKELEANDKDD